MNLWQFISTQKLIINEAPSSENYNIQKLSVTLYNYVIYLYNVITSNDWVNSEWKFRHT